MLFKYGANVGDCYSRVINSNREVLVYEGDDEEGGKGVILGESIANADDIVVLISSTPPPSLNLTTNIRYWILLPS